jgi:hypothetical protein
MQTINLSVLFNKPSIYLFNLQYVPINLLLLTTKSQLKLNIYGIILKAQIIGVQENKK